MPKDEYKKLIKTYMNELNISYITAKQYICLKQKNILNMKKIKSMNKYF